MAIPSDLYTRENKQYSIEFEDHDGVICHAYFYAPNDEVAHQRMFALCSNRNRIRLGQVVMRQLAGSVTEHQSIQQQEMLRNVGCSSFGNNKL